MKKIIGMALVCLAAVCVQAQSWQKKDAFSEKSGKWLDDFEAAKKEAAAFKQPVFALFTGSDWCPWCIKLSEEVLTTKEFKKFASDNLILFIADFPQDKKLSNKVKKQNDELKDKYGVRGFPSVLLLDAEGKELGQTGYETGGGAAYVKSLKALLDKAGVKTEDKPEAAKALSSFEKMKAEKAVKAPQPAAPSK